MNEKISERLFESSTAYWLVSRLIHQLITHRQIKVSNQFFKLISIFFGILIFFKNSFLYFNKIKMKHFETKFASTEFKFNFLNLKKIKKNFSRKKDFLKN